MVSDGKWIVHEQGIGRLSTHATKDAAMVSARAEAEVVTPCELIIRNEDGAIESERTYASKRSV